MGSKTGISAFPALASASNYERLIIYDFFFISTPIMVGKEYGFNLNVFPALM